MCDELRDQTDKKLETAQQTRKTRSTTNGKRGIAALDEGLQMRSSRRPRRDDSGMVLGGDTQLPRIDGGSISSQNEASTDRVADHLVVSSAQALMSLPRAEPPMESLASLPPESLFVPQDMGSSYGLDDLVFDAPVNGIVNFPDFIHWATQMHGSGH